MSHGAVLRRPSASQEAVCAAVARGASVSILAHAGAGKTDVALEACARSPRPTLFLEYNRSLKRELRGRVKGCDALRRCVQAENYDSAVTRWYDDAAASVDFGLALMDVLARDAPLREPLRFERLVVDEAQDLTPEYARLVQKLLRDNAAPAAAVQIVLVGDCKQALSGYRGASVRYLREPEAHFARAFERLSLRETYRFGAGICGPLNELLRPLFAEEDWGGDIAPGALGGEEGRVLLWTARQGSDCSALLRHYEECLRGRPRSVALLARSLLDERSSALWDFLGLAGCADLPPPQFQDDDEEEDRPGGCAAVVTTIHKSKGLAFEHVFLFLGADLDFHGFPGALARDCRQLLYVGATRARRSLHLVQDGASRPLARLAAGAGGGRLALLDASTGEAETSGPPEREDVRAAQQALRSRGRPPDIFRLVERDLPPEEKRVLVEWLASIGAPLKVEDVEEPRISRLVAAAVTLRIEEACGREHALTGLLTALPRGPVGWAQAYRESCRQAMPPRVLRLLSSLPQGPREGWEAAAWLEAAQLHPAFRNGQLDVGARCPGDAALCEALFRRCPSLEGASVVEGVSLQEGDGADRRLLAGGEGRTVLLLFPDAVHLLGVREGSALRFVDAVTATAAAAALGRATARVAYLGGSLRCAIPAPPGMHACVAQLLARGRRRRADGGVLAA